MTDPRYSFIFRLRIWTRRWFFPPFSGWQTAKYYHRLYRDSDCWISNPERLIVSNDGDMGVRERRVRDLNLVRHSIGEGHHRG